MEVFFTEHQSEIYTWAFLITFGVVALWEGARPRRELTAPLKTRWLNNFGLLTANSLLMWLVYPGFGFASAIVAAEYDVGLLHWFEIPYWIAFVVSILVLDIGHYVIHFAFHHVPVLWRIHRVHHSDPDFDVTTGSRFHPLEGLFEHGANLLVIVLLGPPIAAVMIFVLAYLLTTFWVHGNIRMPGRWDARLRRVMVTPEMHRIHHSERHEETNSNYGGLLSGWDRLFGTYVDQPYGGHEGMIIGLREFREEKHIRLPWMIANPFLGNK